MKTITITIPPQTLTLLQLALRQYRLPADIDQTAVLQNRLLPDRNVKEAALFNLFNFAKNAEMYLYNQEALATGQELPFPLITINDLI